MYTDTAIRSPQLVEKQYNLQLTTEQQKQKKHFHRNLASIENQLINIYKQCNVSEDEQREWEKGFKEIKTGMDIAKKITYIEKFDKKLIPTLATDYETLTGFLVKFNAFEQKMNTFFYSLGQQNLPQTDEQILLETELENLLRTELKNLLTDFDEAQKNIQITLDKSIKELDRLKNKISVYGKLPTPSQETVNIINYRSRNEFMDNVINRGLTNSDTKDKDRITAHMNLKTAIENTRLHFNNVKHFRNRLEWGFDVLPLLNLKLEKLPELLNSSKTLMTLINKLDTEIYAADFDPSKDPRSLDNLKNKLEDCKKEAEAMKSFETSLSQLNPFKKTINIKTKDAVDKITKEIEKLDVKAIKLKNSLKNDFENTKFKEDLGVQLKTEVENLKLLKEKIISCCDRFYTDLHELNIHKDIFFGSINLAGNTTSLYLKLETARGILRETRLKEPLRPTHQSIYDTQKEIIDKISNDFLSPKDEFYNTTGYTSTSTTSSVYDSIIFTVPLELITQIKNLFDDNQIYKLDFSKTSINEVAKREEEIRKIAEKMGMVMLEDKKTEQLSLLTLQFKKLQKEMIDVKTKIDKSYKILEDMSALATQDLNLMSRALALKSKEFDEKFQEAYLPKNKAVNFIYDTYQWGKAKVTGDADYYSYEQIQSPCVLTLKEG